MNTSINNQSQFQLSEKEYEIKIQMKYKKL